MSWKCELLLAVHVLDRERSLGSSGFLGLYVGLFGDEGESLGGRSSMSEKSESQSSSSEIPPEMPPAGLPVDETESEL